MNRNFKPLVMNALQHLQEVSQELLGEAKDDIKSLVNTRLEITKLGQKVNEAATLETRLEGLQELLTIFAHHNTVELDDIKHYARCENGEVLRVAIQGWREIENDMALDDLPITQLTEDQDSITFTKDQLRDIRAKICNRISNCTMLEQMICVFHYTFA